MDENCMVKDTNHRLIFLLPVFIALVKLIIAQNVELGNDEVYYFTYAKVLQWSYYDHAPLLGWFLAAFTGFGQWPIDLLMRLPAILLCLLNGYLIFYLARPIWGEKKASLAMLLYHANFYTGFIAGFFILPDSVQLTWWILALFSILKITSNKTLKSRTWLLLGLYIGLATLAKYHGIILWFGFGMYILFYRRAYLRQWPFYAAIAISLLCCLPIVIWNIQNDFASFAFHNTRVGADGGFNPTSFLQFNLGQFFYQNPIVSVLLLWAIVKLKYLPRAQIQRPVLILFCSLPLILFPTLSSFTKSTLPHWSGPAFIGLMLLLLDVLNARSLRRWTNASVALFGLALVAFPLVILRVIPIPLGDFRWQISLWDARGKFIRSALQSDGIKPEESLFVCSKWFPGGHLYYYWQHKNGLAVDVSGGVRDVHHFQWLLQGQSNEAKNIYQYSADSHRAKTYLKGEKYKSDRSKAIRRYPVMVDGKQIDEIVLTPMLLRQTQEKN